MHYRLREDLSCCDVDGHLIFLDVAQDRYFKLTGVLEDAMRRFLAQDHVAPTLVEGLAAAQILVEAQDPTTRTTSADMQRPTCSAIERPLTTSSQRIGLAIVFEVVATVWLTCQQLKNRTLKANLDRAATYRARKTGAHNATASVASEVNLLEATWQFARARRYAPVQPICLLDSLALLRFLSRRGLAANLVFGITPEPFAAHCWVQAGDMALNETLSDANAHTPIRIV